jgi:lipoprotein signal peptidase
VKTTTVPEPQSTPVQVSTASTPEPSALTDVGANVRLWVVAAVAFAFDLWTKSWAFETLGSAESRTWIPDVLRFQRSVNSGALFGMGKGLVPVFIFASLVALGFVLFLFATSGPKRRSLHLALSFVLAGSMGNLYDRVFITADQIKTTQGQTVIGKIIEDDPEKPYILVGDAPDGDLPPNATPLRFNRDDVQVQQIGVVRDFLKFEPIGNFDYWPWVFNVADSLLVAGVGILLLNFWFERSTADADQSGESA